MSSCVCFYFWKFLVSFANDDVFVVHVSRSRSHGHPFVSNTFVRYVRVDEQDHMDICNHTDNLRRILGRQGCGRTQVAFMGWDGARLRCRCLLNSISIYQNPFHFTNRAGRNPWVSVSAPVFRDLVLIVRRLAAQPRGGGFGILRPCPFRSGFVSLARLFSPSTRVFFRSPGGADR